MYLLDTNICIYAIKNKPAEVLAQLRRKRNKGIFISSITVCELEYGVEKSSFVQRNRIALLEFLSLFSIIDFTGNDAQVYGKVKNELLKSGNVIGPLDMLIGSHAKSRGLILVTNNESEFKRIGRLKVENWVSQG